MLSRRFALTLAAAAAILGGLFLARQKTPSAEARKELRPLTLASPVASAPQTAMVVPPAAAAALETDFPLAAPLNVAGSTVAHDLDTIRLILEAWRSNFPHAGNPVGENREITAALTGNNALELVLIPKAHPAINGDGELCDRWGTPLRFHQLSGDRMEIRSAGADGKFGTADDTLWSPAGDTGLR